MFWDRSGQNGSLMLRDERKEGDRGKFVSLQRTGQKKPQKSTREKVNESVGACRLAASLAALFGNELR